VKKNEVLLVCATTEAGDTLAGMLRAGNCAVQTANSFEAACGYLSDGASPVVICERSLSDGDWKDLLDKTPRLIVTSRVADEALWAEVLNLGGYDVLAQPFDEFEVRRVVALAAGRQYDPDSVVN
jgi:DNA-binding response OmpR family regulator